MVVRSSGSAAAASVALGRAVMADTAAGAGIWKIKIAALKEQG